MAWPTIDPGAMRHRITILGPQPITNSAGAAVEMAEVLTAYAEVSEDERGTEKFTPGQVTAYERLVLRMWFDERIKSNMQVKTDHGVWLIEQAVNERKMGIVTRLICIALETDE
jgi:head-tail adaptor